MILVLATVAGVLITSRKEWAGSGLPVPTMPRTRTPARPLAAAGLALPLLLTACGTGGSAASGPSPSAPAEPTPASDVREVAASTPGSR